MTYQYFPELDFWFEDYWRDRGEITVSQINMPVVGEEEDVSTGSVFELMFNVGFDHTACILSFGTVAYTTFPPKIQDRLRIKSTN